MLKRLTSLVRWRGIARALLLPFLLLSPIIIAVAWVIYLYLCGYGVTTDHLLAIVIFFQTYIIWFQVEIGLRQTAVFETEYEPTFKVMVTSEMVGERFFHSASLKNISEYPAYNVFIWCVNRATRKPLEKGSRDIKAPLTLSPTDSVELLSMFTSEYRDMDLELNVMYENMRRQMREFTFVKLPNRDEFMLVRSPLSGRQGILINALEDLKLAYLALKFRTPKKTRKTS